LKFVFNLACCGIETVNSNCCDSGTIKSKPNQVSKKCSWRRRIVSLFLALGCETLIALSRSSYDALEKHK